MKQSFVLFILAVFLLWLIPLGVFIKPSQEKLVCGGQRAICLCSHMTAAKASGKAMESAAGLKSANSAGKEKESSGGAGHYFSTASLHIAAGFSLSSVCQKQYPRYTNPLLSSLEHVPKA